MAKYDTVILNGTTVVPGLGPLRMDIGIKNGLISCLAEDLSGTDGDAVIDARGLHILPGAVDSHFHVGIYRSHAEDARSESASAVTGGVTSILSYFRTGHHYLNKAGPYRQIFPEVLALSSGNFWCDYGYHIAPMTTAQLDEVEWLVGEGVSSFKFYMFYKGLTLSADSTKGREYVMADEYDLGHLFELMEQVATAARRHGQRISLSLHCENPELIRVFIARAKREGLSGLEAYSKSRPPLTESLSIEEAVVLSKETQCPINLLHLSSKAAIETAIDVRRRNPGRDILLEVTLHHLALSYEDMPGINAKVNPPIRAREDRDALWSALLAGQIDTIVSDHACCLEELKRPELWSALPGFGGTALLYPLLITEGVCRRGLALNRVVELVSSNPARHYGMYPKKGTIAIGTDADLAICDLSKTQTVSTELLHSAQNHTPFEGRELTGWPVTTMVRGTVVFDRGRLTGVPGGEFVRRPVASSAKSVG